MKILSAILLSSAFLSAHTFASPRTPGNWVLNKNFSDEFEGNIKPFWRKDSYVTTGYVWTGKEGFWYFTPRSKNIRVENGELVISAYKDYYMPPGETEVRPWSSGIITHSNTVKYGYFEARYKSAPCSLNSAFWLSDVPSKTEGQYELDVQESRGTGCWLGDSHRPNAHQHRQNIHWGPTPQVLGQNIETVYRTYSAHWTPTSISYHFNNRSTPGFVFNHNWMRAPMRLKLSVGVFGDVTGARGTPSNVPVDGGTMRVKWIRTWQEQ